jgi:hypothetical protein
MWDRCRPQDLYNSLVRIPSMSRPTAGIELATRFTIQAVNSVSKGCFASAILILITHQYNFVLCTHLYISYYAHLCIHCTNTCPQTRTSTPRYDEDHGILASGRTSSPVLAKLRFTRDVLPRLCLTHHCARLCRTQHPTRSCFPGFGPGDSEGCLSCWLHTVAWRKVNDIRPHLSDDCRFLPYSQ